MVALELQCSGPVAVTEAEAVFCVGPCVGGRGVKSGPGLCSQHWVGGRCCWWPVYMVIGAYN